MRADASGTLRNLGFAAAARAEALAARVQELFAASGHQLVSPSVVTPAEIFLDRLGERFRSQTLVFEDERGTALCLRPEMTIPAARIALDEGFRGGRRLKLSYAGSVFRLDHEGHLHQSMQAGVEDLGAEDAALADAEIMALAHAAILAPCVDAGIDDAIIHFSDLAFFHALITALGLGPHQRAQVLRRFDAAGSAMFAFRLPVISKAGHAGVDAGRVARMISEGGLLCGVRSADDIAARLAEREAARAEGPVPEKAQSVLAAFFALSFDADKAASGLAAFFTAHDLPAPDFSSFTRRLDLLKAKAPGARLKFDPRVHAPLGYYSGLEFRIEARGRVLASGGRYDALLPQLLGNPASVIPAVGAAVMLDALVELCP